MNFITDLSQSSKIKNDAVMIIIDAFIKMIIFISVKLKKSGSQLNVKKTVKIVIKHVFFKHGLSKMIVTDQNE
jgi:hypothetical protein